MDRKTSDNFVSNLIFFTELFVDYSIEERVKKAILRVCAIVSNCFERLDQPVQTLVLAIIAIFFLQQKGPLSVQVDEIKHEFDVALKSRILLVLLLGTLQDDLETYLVELDCFLIESAA